MPCLAVDTSPRVTDTGLSASDRLGFPAVNVLFRSFLSCQHARFSVMQLFYTQTQNYWRLFGQDQLSRLLLSCSCFGLALWNETFKSSLLLLMIILNQSGEPSFSKLRIVYPQAQNSRQQQQTKGFSECGRNRQDQVLSCCMHKSAILLNYITEDLQSRFKETTHTISPTNQSSLVEMCASPRVCQWDCCLSAILIISHQCERIEVVCSFTLQLEPKNQEKY